ncbi:class I SAM-dependent methyltransferase [Metallumcola ferriviriculae]|uniref:Class I SAM-dependent methyltransferase n=1 Tax=Metallumcola ferriviriculae TaxID=3039180 RepID=A0AAU0USF3_9FIRM|nr:class I SAM-dependent methyltransferase [Desulfitibacteraceae bacterium MK1]
MEFYDQLSVYYDYIFPAADQTVKFLADNFGEPPQRLLDVACGSGNYTLAMARQGNNVTGVDLSERMVDLAREKAVEIEDVAFLPGDMRHLSDIGGHYQGVFCLGNSFVHLLNDQDMKQALKSIRERLGKAGVLIMQTVNYDRILKFHVTQLPPVKNDKVQLVFKRYYDFREDGLLDFRTVLEIPEGNFNNTVVLRPLLVGKMRNLLSACGFHLEAVCGGFDGRPHDAESPATVVVAKRS